MAGRKISSAITRLPQSELDWAGAKKLYMRFKLKDYYAVAEHLGCTYQRVVDVSLKYGTAGKTWRDERDELVAELETAYKNRLKTQMIEEFGDAPLENMRAASKIRSKAIKDIFEKVKRNVKDEKGNIIDTIEVELPFDHDQALRAIGTANGIEKETLLELVEPPKKDEAKVNINMTAIDKLVLVIQSAGGDVGSKIVEALRKKALP